MIELTWVILLLPLLCFVVLSLLGDRLSPRWAGGIGTTCMLIAGVLACMVGIAFWGKPTSEALIVFDYRWLPFMYATFTLGILVDQISALMLIVITIVSALVHIYSLGYMKGERGFQRYYAYLSLFSFSMLGLVVATNIFQMYLFWELVGVSSYLLIGFYYTAPAAVSAAKKAFIVTRFADLFFLIGILIYGFHTGTYAFDLATAPHIADAAAILPLSLGLMFVGGAGKSAMFPLHIWLPDAMEGPTPASALIHAATMVVAGVYLVARLFPLFIAYAPEVLHAIAIVGAVTAFYAACVACVQTDIKRVLAFSTISQIGFMMVGLGVSTSIEPHQGGLGYMAAMFHLFTHALFKALLFLGAGCIIHAVHSNELSAMGQLRRSMPITHLTFLVACLAISGIYPFSGFFSKDEILVATFAFSPLLGWVMSVIAAMTSFYMFRLYFGIFWGSNGRHANHSHAPHEAPAVMTAPLVLLAIATCVAGFIPFGMLVSSDGSPYHIHIDWGIAAQSLLLSCTAIGIATYLYARPQQAQAEAMKKCFATLHRWATHRFYIDEVYQFVTHRIIFAGISRPIAWFDKAFVDGFFEYLAHMSHRISQWIREWQSGQVQQYAVGFAVGIILLTLVMIF